MFRRLCFALPSKVLAGFALYGLISCGGSATPATTGTAGPFAGQWSAHDTSVTVDPSGHGILTWRTYKTCGQDPPPCDSMSGNTITAGGRATILVTAIGDDTARGQVLTSTDPADFPPGPLKARLDPHADVVFFSPFPGGPHDPVCGPRAKSDVCGA